MEKQRFEHKIRTIAINHFGDNFADYEKDGWEFAGITDGYDKTTRIIIFKRPFGWPFSDNLAKTMNTAPEEG